MSDLEAALSKAMRNTGAKKSINKETQKQSNKETKKLPVKGKTLKRGRGGHLESVNPWSKRITFDTTPEQGRWLASFALNHNTKVNPILRELASLLEEKKELQTEILQIIEKNKSS